MKYAPGKLGAKGTRNGQTLQTIVETTGAPAAIALEPDRATLTADGADVSLLTVKIVDAQGRTVPVATNAVTFNGLCLAIIQSARESGALRIQADSPGLKSATVGVEAR